MLGNRSRTLSFSATRAVVFQLEASYVLKISSKQPKCEKWCLSYPGFGAKKLYISPIIPDKPGILWPALMTREAEETIYRDSWQV